MTKISNLLSSVCINLAPNPKLLFAKNTGALLQFLTIGSNNIHPFKQIMAKFFTQNNSKNFKNVMPNLNKYLWYQKINCYNATLNQQLDTVHKLHCQHNIKLLCNTLDGNKSTYYKHYNAKSANYNKRLGAYKITIVWVSDFTYIKSVIWHHLYIVIDLFSYIVIF